MPRMAATTMESGTKESDKVRAFSYCYRLGLSMRETGSKTRCTGREKRYQIALLTKGPSKKERSMVKVRSQMLAARKRKANGSTASAHGLKPEQDIPNQL